MNLIKRLCREENGQGLVEYTFVVMLMALVFWLGVKIPPWVILWRRTGPRFSTV